MKHPIITICLILLSSTAISAQSWTDISSAKIATLGTQPWPGGCAGVAVNRLTGDALINIIGFGIWKSGDKGLTWTRIDNNTVSGRCETGFGVQIDQNDPKRMAVFSLDGDAAYTADGTTWKKLASMGRNWDFGTVDWSTPSAQVMMVLSHESGGKVYKSVNGGAAWTQMNITVDAQNANDRCMLGIIDANTFIYSNGSGIKRSTDQGATWANASTSNARGKVAVVFKGNVYVCASTGVLKSTDKGATWALTGSTTDAWAGPYFGADENTMVVAGTAGVYKSANGGSTWTKLANIPTTTQFVTYNPNWFGGFSWDPVNNVIYSTAMFNPAVKYQLAGTPVAKQIIPKPLTADLSIINHTIHSKVSFTRYEVYSALGNRLYAWQGKASYSADVPESIYQGNFPVIIKVTTVKGIRSLKSLI